MNMLIHTDYWTLLCITFGLMLLFTFIMSILSLRFYTHDVVDKKFNIMDLELAATAMELQNLIKGLYKLPQPKSNKAIWALRGHLYIDFLLMPCAYGSIFILCSLVSTKMQSDIGRNIFLALAWLQLISWIFDIIENIFLLWKINPNPVSKTDLARKKHLDSVHKAFLIMVFLKWGIALTALICAIATISYFWLAGFYSLHTLSYLLIIIGETLLFLFFYKNRIKIAAKQT